jgi:hypothetical protein
MSAKSKAPGKRRLDHEEVVRLLVEGELFRDPLGRERRRFPGTREIARRYGVAPSLIHRIRVSRDVTKRRVEWLKGHPEVAEMLELQRIERSIGRAITNEELEPEPPRAAEATPSMTADDESSDDGEPRSGGGEPGDDDDLAPPPYTFGPKKPGRRKTADGPTFPVNEVDRLLVFGELTRQADGTTAVSYPSIRDLARRYAVAHTTLLDYAKHHQVYKRREKALARIQNRVEEKLVEMRAEAIAVSKEEAVRIIDRYIRQFEQAVVDERVRSDSPADFNTMLRLKEFILGGADSRTELHATLSLETLQERHARALEAAREVTPAEMGIVETEGREVRSAEPPASDENADDLSPDADDAGTASAPPDRRV